MGKSKESGMEKTKKVIRYERMKSNKKEAR